jgi:hypothetical protein
MSDFVIIAPTGWTAIDIDFIINTLNVGLDTLKNYADIGVFNDFEPLLKDNMVIPADKTITAMKVINDSQLWVTLG